MDNVGTSRAALRASTTMKLVSVSFVALLIGCSQPSPPAASSPPASAVKVARVVCQKDGSTSISTPDVLAQADGVHVHVTNRLNEPASIVGLGFDVSPGASDWVEAYRPGVLRVACWPFSQHPEGGAEPVEIPVKVYDPDHLFVEWELECTNEDDGTMLDIRLLASPHGKQNVSITPEDARPLIKGLREDDEVVVPGYPDEVRQGVVVIRDGRRIASVGFSFEGGRWIQAGGQVCGGPSVVA
jgi:hypothetical protein